MKKKTIFLKKRIIMSNMFDRLAVHYDLLNKILSFGQDALWRRKITLLIKNREKITILDLAAGTCDISLSIVKSLKNIKKIIAVDISSKMLNVGRKKIKKNNMESIIITKKEDITKLSFNSNTFSLCVMGFGIRNVEKPKKCLQEIFRVLNKGGQIIILEFSIPKNILIRNIYFFYFRYIVPRIGGFITGYKNAYIYLNKTVESFPCGESFLDLMRASNFIKLSKVSLTFGIVTIYIGYK